MAIFAAQPRGHAGTETTTAAAQAVDTAPMMPSKTADTDASAAAAATAPARRFAMIRATREFVATHTASALSTLLPRWHWHRGQIIGSKRVDSGCTTPASIMIIMIMRPLAPMRLPFTNALALRQGGRGMAQPLNAPLFSVLLQCDELRRHNRGS